MIKTVSGLQYEDLKVTDGPVVQQGQKVQLNYWIAFALADLGDEIEANLVDSSTRHKGSIVITVGAGEVIPGVDEALVGMRRGATRRLIVPPDLAFGERGIPFAVPANTTLYIDLNVSTKI